MPLDSRKRSPLLAAFTADDEGFLKMALAYIEIGKIAASAKSELKNTDEYQKAAA